VVTGGLEAAGDAITGAVIGRAVEPAHGEGTAIQQGACLNCGVELIGAHCHACGQKAQVHRTLRSYGHDLLHGVFHFEGKVWKTLPMLAFKPGELTRRYIHGERAKFVSPLALFLFAVFLMFAVVGGLAGEMHAPDMSDVQISLKNKPLAELDKGLKEEQARKTAIDAQIARVDAADGDTAALEKQSDAIEKDIEGIGIARSLLKGEKPTVLGGLNSGWARLDNAIIKANENPNLFLYKLQSSAYKYSWALIPLSLPFVWLLFFWKRQFKLYDHAVFVTYSLTFMLFLVVGLTVIGFAGAPEPVVPIAGTFIPPMHIYKQMRGAYGVSRVGGLLRTFLLGIFGIVVLTLFLVLLVAVGVLG
jgi:Protein of unknown function (DUF3667)